MSLWPVLRNDLLPSRHRVRLRRFAGPRAFSQQMKPLRIAHLSDQHVGAVTPFSIQKEAILRATAQNPDLVVLTGDFVCHSQLYLDQLTEVLRLIHVPAIAVLGNHDHWAGASEVRAALRAADVTELKNENTVITLRGQALQVVGLDDAYTGHADVDAATKGMRPDLPTIGLSHIAEEADGLWRRRVPLVLSGHTHGGQITVARLHEIALGKVFGHRYVHGLYGSRRPLPEEGPAGAVYVSAGIGASVVPFRMGERGMREVAIFELGVAPGAFREHHSEQPALPGRKPTPAQREKRARAVIDKQRRRDRKR